MSAALYKVHFDAIEYNTLFLNLTKKRKMKTTAPRKLTRRHVFALPGATSAGPNMRATCLRNQPQLNNPNKHI